jgi:hypothetical protein
MCCDRAMVDVIVVMHNIILEICVRCKQRTLTKCVCVLQNVLLERIIPLNLMNYHIVDEHADDHINMKKMRLGIQQRKYIFVFYRGRFSSLLNAVDCTDVIVPHVLARNVHQT